jgi:excisionase family DNA binding protein
LKLSETKNYDDLPLFLNAEMVAKVLGVSISSAYELMHEKDFPSVRIGKRFIVPREDHKAWIENYVERKTKR